MSKLEEARQRWKSDASNRVAEDKAKKAKKEAKPRATNARKAPAKPAAKAEPITDMKAHLKTHVLPQTSGVALSKQIKDSIDALQKAQLSLDAEQLQELTGHACGPGTALGEQLAANPMVVVTDGRYKYKAAADQKVDNRKAALRFIRKFHGCLLRQLTALYENAERDVERLKKDGQIWVLPAAEKGQMMLFPRETDPNLTVSQDIRKAWLSVEMPDDAEEEAKALKRAKLESAVQRGKRERPKAVKKDKQKKKRATNFNRFTKITNQHLPELFKGEAQSID